MGALNPLFLLAGLSIAVPIYLHLFHRHQARRLSFPALRYLERTEREHARQIRLRQILLMIARVLALLLVVGAGSRLFFSGRGASHPPTAAVLIVDNSLSSGLVVGEVRVLDELKGLARTAVDGATDGDRFWVLRAGEPWLPAIPGGAAEARAAIEAIDATESQGDLSDALTRAARLLASSSLEHKEIHLLSDLQASAFPGLRISIDSIPVIVWRGHAGGAANRALTEVVVGGGLPPLEGQRTDVTVAALEPQTEADTSHVPLRLVVDERIRGATTIPAGAQTTIAMPPTGGGWIQGYVDADPDNLRADDRRYFAFRSRAAPRVALTGDAGIFVREAMAVLEEAGRIERSSVASADLVLAESASGLDAAPDGAAIFVVPPSDPTLLPALNRRLADAGIAWRVSPAGGRGRVEIEGFRLPPALTGVWTTDPYLLAQEGDALTPSLSWADAGTDPWLVDGFDARGRRFLLLASPLNASGTNLPVSTGMLRFIDWVASEWAGAGGGTTRWTTGSHLSAPNRATHVTFPNGSLQEIDGTRMVRGTGRAGLYTFTEADTIVSVVAVNPPVDESRLAAIPEGRLEALLGAKPVVVDEAGDWEREIYRARQGPELWWPFLAAAMLLLLAETLMATSGERTPFARARDEHD